MEQQIISAIIGAVAALAGVTISKIFHYMPLSHSKGVMATALLDRLLHHAIVVQIEGSSYRLREHADLLPEHLLKHPAGLNPAPAQPARRRVGRPPKERN